ncbi:MAG TPA: RHS repeat-associated core domain-containing protein [Verrucomicrobiae bacterium]|nr:RHS repeat-associated core domain-containing protein [Verrucomicrobiae bacterium]
MSDAVGTTVFTWDAVGELTSEDGPWSNDTVSYTYANRLRTGLILSQPSGSWSQSYGYDSARRLTSVISPAGEFDYSYVAQSVSAGSLVGRLSLPNGSFITNSYDSVARLLSTKLLNSSSSVLDSESYGYNLASQRTAETNTVGDFRNYTYDNEGELLTAIGKEAGGTTNRLQEQLGYVYDAAGNLNYRTNNGLLGAFNVNNLNELTSVTNGGRLTVAGTTTVPATSVTVNTSNAFLYADATFASTNQPWANGNNTYTAIGQDSYGRVSSNSVTVNLLATNNYYYDLNGNLTNDGTRNFAYDDENQLIGVWAANSWSNNFTYDGKLRRRVEKDYNWNGSSWIQTNEIHFIYDGNVVIQERDASNNPLVTYTRGNDLSGTLQGVGGIGGLLARTDYGQEIPGSPTTAYYHADGNGNITMLIYTNQIIAAKYLYDPYGDTLSLSGPLADLNVYRFSSKEWNSSAGLYYYLYRFYDPTLQRWLNQDPIKEQGGLNLYTVVHNDPINNLDPFGLASLWDYKMFAKWLFDPFASQEIDVLSWDKFDPTGSAANFLKNDWLVQNFAIFRQKCRNAPMGSSIISSSELSPVVDFSFLDTQNAWISWWRGSAFVSPLSNGVSLDKDCKKCVFNYHLLLTAKDRSDFNPGQSFSSLWVLGQDNTWIWVRDHTPLGHDFDIFGSTDIEGEWTYEY